MQGLSGKRSDLAAKTLKSRRAEDFLRLQAEERGKPATLSALIYYKGSGALTKQDSQ